LKYRKGSAARPQAPAAPRPEPGASIDLHLHSSHSDGALAPAALVVRAREAGVAVLSLTDHDSVRASPRPGRPAGAKNLTFIPGIELGVGVGSDEVHLLGYGIDTKGRPLQNALDQLAGSASTGWRRWSRPSVASAYRSQLEDVQAETGGGIVGRLHLASALVRRGHAANHGEAFKRWIGAGRPAYVQRAS